MFSRIKYFFYNIRDQFDWIKNSSARQEREVSKIHQRLDEMDKNYQALSFNVVEIRNMMARVTSDFSLMTLEMAMKPIAGERPFQKVLVPYDMPVSINLDPFEHR